MTRQVLAVAALVLTAGCADAIRISVAAGRVVCGALGCPCASAAAPASSGRVIGFDVYPDGGVRAVRSTEP